MAHAKYSRRRLRDGANDLIRRLLTISFAMLALGAGSAFAASDTALDRYLEGLQSLRITFTQTLADSHGKELDRTRGTLLVLRPGKFRWELAGGEDTGGQLMVADGRNVWFFDRDLEQVTVKPADAALSATPAMLLSGTVDVRENFKLEDAGTRDGLNWLLVEPKRSDADFRSALLGFGAGGALQRMIVEDRLGQTATLLFEKSQRNAKVSPEEVSFTPPKGTDLIGTPVK
jgi:outer membrane lipoprotein carrier protein